VSKANATFEAMTAAFIERIEEGTAGKWTKPWIDLGHGLPKNASTSACYRGGNALIALIEADTRDYSTQWWATYKQWEQLGAQVQRGEGGISLVKWGMAQCRDHGPEESCSRCGRMYARGFTVFNADQVEGWQAPEEPALSTLERHQAADKFFEAVGSAVEYGGDRACYSPATDIISMPTADQFADQSAFYATLAHEHGHWTGHESRLGRNLEGRFGSASYAMEELVAELTAVFVCAELGITALPREDHCAYLAHWLEVLAEDSQALWRASSEAQKAATFMQASASDSIAEVAA
jgi:antirestriction protein ArdC